jgi:hypothetical protein
MNSGQKVIVCVALGVVVVVLGFAARAWWWESDASGGWFNYAPHNGVIFTQGDPDRAAVVAQVLVWLALDAAWAAVCLYVLRTRGAATETTVASDPA